MRIAHVSAAMDHGGAERIVADLAVHQAAEGHDVGILAPAGDLDRDWRRAGVERILTPAAGRQPLEVLRSAMAVRRALRHWRPDIVHAHNVKATVVARFAAARLRDGTPVLATFHGVQAGELARSARLLRGAALVAVVSAELAEAIVRAGLPRELIEVVPNGVDLPVLPASDVLDAELGLRGDIIAAVGRLAPVKAHDRYLAAAALVLEQRPETTFLLVGDGECRAALEAQAAELGMTGSIRFTGMRDDARELMARADLVVFSSDSEGLSMAALEALAAGTPVVSTDVPGMGELLGGGAGVMVDRDHRALAGAIVDLMADPARRTVMGAAGRRLVAQRYSATAMRTAYGDLYERVIARR